MSIEFKSGFWSLSVSFFVGKIYFHSLVFRWILKKVFRWMGPSFFDDQILCLGKKTESVSVIIGSVDFKRSL